jgi:hypothetical protein
MTTTSPFRKFGTAVHRDQLIAKLCQLSFDGSECFGIVAAELHDPELEHAASAIRHAILSQYRDCVPVDAVLEIVGELLEDEGLV